MIELIKVAGLIKTVEDVGPFQPRLMHELIVNLPTGFNDISSADYQKVHVRGICINISPALLNQFLGLSVTNDLVITYPSNEQLGIELMDGGTVRSWLDDG